MPNSRLTVTLAALLLAGPWARAEQDVVAANQALVNRSPSRWETNPHGPMLARILPPWKSAASLPEPDSRGARLAARFCVQCHYLPNPAMHPADRWPRVVERMVARMQGRGNMGQLMKDMMAEVSAPGEEEVRTLIDYLQLHGQKPIDPRHYPDLATRGHAFREACSQCHELPDPKSHKASEWPRIVARMERNMQWMTRVVGSKPNAAEPRLPMEEIVTYLQQNAARE